MPTYKAPLDDMKFVLNDVIDYARLTSLPEIGRASCRERV